MSRSLTLSDELFDKLAQSASHRGLTIESLLAFISELVRLPERPTERDQERSRHIERLLIKYRAGPLTEQDRADLDHLIDADYQEAIARADQLIAVKKSGSISF
jgi:hypothetical protein